MKIVYIADDGTEYLDKSSCELHDTLYNFVCKSLYILNEKMDLLSTKELWEGVEIALDVKYAMFKFTPDELEKCNHSFKDVVLYVYSQCGLNVTNIKEPNVPYMYIETIDGFRSLSSIKQELSNQLDNIENVINKFNEMLE